MNRRNVLRTVGVMGAVGTFGLPAFSGSVAASSHVTETLYLTDSGGDNAGNFLGKLYSVDLDDSFSPPRANLTLLEEFPDAYFDQVDAIAASADGTTVYMVDKNSKHLGTYDVASDSFDDEGVISGLPGGVVLASYSPSGTLYVASQDDNTLYTVDPTGPSATAFVTVSGADVQGADIAFDADGTLYLYSSSDQELYTVDYDSSSGTFGNATFVGATGDFFTGLAIRDAGDGDLVGSNTTRDEVVVVDKSTGAQGTAYEMYLDGSRYAYGFGDMTVGALDVCDECTSEDLLAKYEFACVEEVDGECVDYDFVFEKGDDTLVTYEPGSFMSKDGEAFEPVSATFDTDYCSVWAVVKAGQEIKVQELVADDGEVTAEYVAPYAISFVAFYCTEEAAEAAADAFPSNGKGKGKGKGN
jgi:sugar lactone lactonase YvrE